MPALPNIPTVEKGDRILASSWNQMAGLINLLGGGQSLGEDHIVLGTGVYRRTGRGGRASGTTFIIGELTTAITAASHPKSGATTATLKKWKRQVGTGGALDDDTTETITNRSVDLTAAVGTMVIAAKILGEWIPVWVDCGAFAESSA